MLHSNTIAGLRTSSTMSNLRLIGLPVHYAVFSLHTLNAPLEYEPRTLLKRAIARARETEGL